MAFHTKKDLKSKNVRGKVFFVSKDVNSEKNLNQSQNKFRLEKGLFFRVTLREDTHKKVFFYMCLPYSPAVQNTLLQNISTLKKSASSHYYEPR